MVALIWFSNAFLDNHEYVQSILWWSAIASDLLFVIAPSLPIPGVTSSKNSFFGPLLNGYILDERMTVVALLALGEMVSSTTYASSAEDTKGAKWNKFGCTALLVGTCFILLLFYFRAGRGRGGTHAIQKGRRRGTLWTVFHLPLTYFLLLGASVTEILADNLKCSVFTKLLYSCSIGGFLVCTALLQAIHENPTDTKIPRTWRLIAKVVAGGIIAPCGAIPIDDPVYMLGLIFMIALCEFALDLYGSIPSAEDLKMQNLFDLIIRDTVEHEEEDRADLLLAPIDPSESDLDFSQPATVDSLMSNIIN